MTAADQQPIRARGVTVRYGDVVAVDGVDLDLRQDEILGVIGPNGAGKTSLVECLEGLRPRAAGEVTVLGLDPASDRRALVPQIGAQLQSASFPTRTRVAEVGRLFTSFYADPRSFDQLLDQFGLADKDGALVAELSGGQRQKLALVLAVLGRPAVLFLDELTTGLDPASRRATWALLRDLNRDGASVILTSHYMDEIEALCDRVVLLVDGSVRAEGTVSSFIDRCVDGHHYTLDEELAAQLDGGVVRSLAGIVAAEMNGGRLVARGRHPAGWDALVEAARARGLDPSRIRHRPPTMEDAFIQLAGATPAESDSGTRAEEAASAG